MRPSLAAVLAEGQHVNPDRLRALLSDLRRSTLQELRAIERAIAELQPKPREDVVVK